MHNPTQVIAGKTVVDWVNLFQACHNMGMGFFIQWCWPNGLSYMEQSKIDIDMFQIIKAEAEHQISKKMGKK